LQQLFIRLNGRASVFAPHQTSRFHLVFIFDLNLPGRSERTFFAQLARFDPIARPAADAAGYAYPAAGRARPHENIFQIEPVFFIAVVAYQ
jgi:hypothetical protein